MEEVGSLAEKGVDDLEGDDKVEQTPEVLGKWVPVDDEVYESMFHNVRTFSQRS